MRNHPLYSKVCKIIESQPNGSSIGHSEFEGIRNQASVRAILKFKGYNPNCPIMTIRWSLDEFADLPKDEFVDRELMQINAVSVSINQVREMLLSGQEVFVDEIAFSRKYFMNLIGRYRRKGYVIEKRTCEGSTRAFSYKFRIEQKDFRL